MDSHVFNNIVDFHQWNRRVMNAYWIVFGGTFMGFALISIFAREQDLSVGESFLTICLAPSAIIAAVLAVTELILRSGSHLRHYFMLISGTAFSVVIVSTLPAVPGVQMVFLPPLFASLTYYDKRKIYFSFVLNAFSFFILYFFHPDIQGRIGTGELLITIFSLINCLVILLSLMSRGVDLHRALLTSNQHKQELLIEKNLMEKLSKTDALTDLYNHKTFHEHMTRLLDQPEPRVAVHLALLDIDNFKQINDTFGHWAGDQVLKRISETIRNHMTGEDYAFRYGGEEFAILFTGKTQEGCYAVLERIRKEFSETEHDELNGGTVSVSIGLQSYRPDMGRERFFKDADNCLYEAKRRGKNCVVCGSSFSRVKEI